MKTPGQDNDISDDSDEKPPIVEAHVRPDAAAAAFAHWLRTPAGRYLLGSSKAPTYSNAEGGAGDKAANNDPTGDAQ